MTDIRPMTPEPPERRAQRRAPRRRPGLLPRWHGRPLDMALRIALAGLVGLLVGMAHYLLAPPEYSASTLVSVTPAVSPGQKVTIDDLMQVRYTQALARVAMSDQVAAPALQAAGLHDMVAKPKLYLTTSAAPDTAVFTLTGRARSSADAVKAVSVVARATADEARERHVPVVLDFAPPYASQAPSPGLMPRLVLGTCVGLACGGIWVLLLLDRRWTMPMPRSSAASDAPSKENLS